MKQAIINIGDYTAFSFEALKIREDRIVELAVSEGVKAALLEASKKEILNTKQVAKQCNVSISTIKRWINTGKQVNKNNTKLKAIQEDNGSRYLITRYDLNVFLEKIRG